MSKEPSKVSISKRKLILSLVSVLLIGVIASGSLMYVVAQSSLSTITIAGGPYPGAPSYTIFAESGTNYVKNANGVIVYSSTNTSYVIQSCITTNAHILVKPGTYTITNTLLGNVAGVILEGESKDTTIIKLAASTSINMLNVTASDWTIKNIQFDGSDASQVWGDAYDNQNGIFIGNTAATLSLNDITITNCYIHDTMGGAIAVRGSDVRRVFITSNTIMDTPRDGIRVMLCKDVNVIGNIFQSVGSYVDLNNKWHSIYTYGQNHIIANNNIYKSGGDGIEVYGLDNGTITGNLIAEAGRIGIYVQGSVPSYYNIVVSGNTVVKAGANAAANWKDGIRIVCPNVICSNNIVDYSGAVGIYVAGYSVGCVVANNVVSNSAQVGINIYANNNFVAVTGNTLRNNQDHQILFDQAINFTCTGNNVFGITSKDGIRFLGSSHGIVSNNNVNWASYGIREAGACGYINYVGNNVFNTGYGIQLYGDNATATSRITACYNATWSTAEFISSWGAGALSP